MSCDGRKGEVNIRRVDWVIFNKNSILFSGLMKMKLEKGGVSVLIVWRHSHV
jgi:hypothetical protein